jgi:hypothetical protein
MEGIYLNDIARKLGIDPLEISRIEVQFLGEGALKHVTNNILYTPSQYPKSFIIGIDLLSAVARNVHTCKMEFEDFKNYHDRTKLLPESYGYINLEDPNGLFGIIYKEFLPGIDADIYSKKIIKPELLQILFRNIGKSIGQIYHDTGMNSADFKLANLIVDRIEQCPRFCDIVPFGKDMAEIMRGFKSIFNEIPKQYRSDALSGILEVGESGREFLGRIREALKNDNENMDDIPSPKALKEIDDFVISLSKDPESFFR